MTIDAIACEPQFLDHLAPVWSALPSPSRGRFLVEPRLLDRAAAAGIPAEPIDVDAIRRTPQHAPVRDGISTLVSSIGDIKVGRRLGHGPFVFLEHGAGQAYQSRAASMASYPGGPDRQDNEVFLCPNEYSASRWRAAYPLARVAIVGSPRLDTLPRRVPGPGPVVAISFHGDWPMGVPYGGNAVSDFLPALEPLAKRFTVIGHAHPGKGWGERLARVYRRFGIPFVAEFDDVCRQADVYVCDNSSTIFEFATTGRPVVLMNARVWGRRGGPGLRFWDAAHVGPNADRADELIPAIERAMEHRPEDVAAREAALEFVYAYRYGAAGRAADVITDWLRQSQRLVA